MSNDLPALAALSALSARIDRLESIEEIRMLPAKYALSLDMRDLDAHVNLFAPDIRISKEQVGRAHLKRWLDALAQRPACIRGIKVPVDLEKQKAEAADRALHDRKVAQELNNMVQR